MRNGKGGSAWGGMDWGVLLEGWHAFAEGISMQRPGNMLIGFHRKSMPPTIRGEKC